MEANYYNSRYVFLPLNLLLIRLLDLQWLELAVDLELGVVETTVNQSLLDARICSTYR